VTSSRLISSHLASRLPISFLLLPLPCLVPASPPYCAYFVPRLALLSASRPTARLLASIFRLFHYNKRHTRLKRVQRFKKTDCSLQVESRRERTRPNRIWKFLTPIPRPFARRAHELDVQANFTTGIDTQPLNLFADTYLIESAVSSWRIG